MVQHANHAHAACSIQMCLQGKVRYVVDKANDMRVVADGVCVGAEKLHADVLVTACASPHRPSDAQSQG